MLKAHHMADLVHELKQVPAVGWKTGRRHTVWRALGGHMNLDPAAGVSRAGAKIKTADSGVAHDVKISTLAHARWKRDVAYGGPLGKHLIEQGLVRRCHIRVVFDWNEIVRP